MATAPEWNSHHRAMQGFARVINGFIARFIPEQLPDQPPMSMPCLQLMLKRLESNWAGYSRSHLAISSMMDALDQDAVQLNDDFNNEMEEVAERYAEAKAVLEGRMEPCVVPAPPPLPRPNEVTIPQFSGNYLEYTAFRSAVLARVYSQAYPAHVKIDIIMRAITGEAKVHVGHVRGQDMEELERIWRCLEGTYHNRYLLQRSHMGAIYEQPELKRESASAYRAMADRISQNMHALRQLDIPTGQLDPAILEMVLRKLDQRGTQHWETTRPKDVLPTIQSFVAFLEERIVILQNTAIQTARTEQIEHADNRGEIRLNARHRNNHVDSNKRTSIHQGSNDAKRLRTDEDQVVRTAADGRPKAPGTCLMECQYKRPHHLWLCNKFKAMDLDNRIAFIKKHGLCRRCITLKHKVEHCTSPKCTDCKDDIHNQVLCPRHMVIARINTARTSNKGGQSSKNPFVRSA